MINRFRKKPVVIEAIQWTGENNEEVERFICPPDVPWERKNPDHLTITTLEGNHLANKGDWIIKGVHGEFYPCKPDIFGETYELIG